MSEHTWFSALVDLDPPLLDHVLEMLSAADIEAYCEPLAGDAGPYRDIHPPNRPTTRVYVATDSIEAARDIIADALPSLRADFLADAAARVDRVESVAAEQDFVDRAWADIVASYGDRIEPEMDDPQPEPPPFVASEPLIPGPRDYMVAEEPEEGYTPPEPPPLPRPSSKASGLAWAGVIGGPLVYLAAFFLHLDTLIRTLAIVATVAGLVTLVWQMKDHHDHDDDGAIV